MAITTWAATTGDWDDSKFSRAWDGPSIAPAVGSLSLSTAVPIFKIEYFISPDKADFELIQSYEWNEMSAAWDETAYSWETGPSPSIAVGLDISPAKADLTLTGSIPAQGVIYTFPVANADLTVTGKIPFAGIGTTISPDKGDLEIVQTYSWDNYGGTWANAGTDWEYIPFVPDAVEEGKNQPDKADLTLTSYAPIRTESMGFPIPKGDLTLTGYAPPFGTSHFRSPGAVNLTGLGTTSWNETTGDWNSSSATWGEGTLSPIPGITYTFPIDGTDMEFDSTEPIWPYVRQPTYKPQVIIS